MKRLNLAATVYQSEGPPPTWVVEAIDMEGDGDVYMAVFQGPDAEGLAEEYAAQKYESYEKRH